MGDLTGRKEVERTKAELQRLKARLQAYEEQHGMRSEVFYRQFRSGELGDDKEDS